MKNVTLVKQSYQNDTLLPRKCNKQQNQFGSSDIKSYQLNNMKQSKNSDINQYNWEIILSQAMTDKESTYLPAQKKITCSICGKDITTGNSVGNKDGDYCVPCWYKKEEKERQEEEAELMHKPVITIPENIDAEGGIIPYNTSIIESLICDAIVKFQYQIHYLINHLIIQWYLYCW